MKRFSARLALGTSLFHLAAFFGCPDGSAVVARVPAAARIAIPVLVPVAPTAPAPLLPTAVLPPASAALPAEPQGPARDAAASLSRVFAGSAKIVDFGGDFGQDRSDFKEYDDKVLWLSLDPGVKTHDDYSRFRLRAIQPLLDSGFTHLNSWGGSFGRPVFNVVLKAPSLGRAKTSARGLAVEADLASVSVHPRLYSILRKEEKDGVIERHLWRFQAADAVQRFARAIGASGRAFSDALVSSAKSIAKAASEWRMTRPPRRLSDFKWENGYRPVDFGWNTLGSLWRLPRGAVITVLRAEDRLLNVDRQADGTMTDRFTGQALLRNGPYEDMLSETSGRQNAREVVHARAYDRSGGLVGSSRIGVPPLIYGPNAVDEGTVWTVLDTLPRRSGVFLIEIAHTHPAYEFSYRYSAKGRTFADTRISPLGDDDLALLQRISRVHRGVFIRGKAVVGNGYSYSLTLKNGAIVDDPLAPRP